MKQLKYKAWGIHEEKMWEWEQVQKIDGWWKHEGIKLCEFTGLKDKNGKEIYEGDIINSWLQVSEGEDNKLATDVIEDIRNLYNLPSGHAFDNSWLLFEIIGNIYQDGHLLNNK